MNLYASSTEPQYGQAPSGTQERDDSSLPSHFQSQSAVNGYGYPFTNNYDHVDEIQFAGAPHGDYTMVPPEIAAYYRQQASFQQDAPPSSLPSASSSSTWSTNEQSVNGSSIGTTQYWTSGNQQFQSYPPAPQQYQSSGQNVYQSVPMPLQGSIVGSSAILAHPAPSATIGNPSSASSTSTYNNPPQTQLVGDNAPNQVYVESHDAPLGGTTSLTQDPSRNRAQSSSSQHSLHSDSIGHGHMQQYPVTGASRTFVDPLHHGKQDSGYWNGNNQQYAQPHLQQQHQQQMASSAPLHRSASAGNIASQQYQAVDLPQSAYNYAHRGSVSALPTVSRFGGQHGTTSGRPGMLRGLSHGVGQMAYNDSATDKEVLASPKATDRPSLSLHTNASALETAWVSGPSTGEAFQRSASSGSHPEHTYAFVQNPAPVSAISQFSNATYRSQYSNDSSQASLRPGPSIVNQQYGQRDVYDMRESPYTGPAADSWPRSLSNTNASSGHGETHPQHFYNGGGETNVYQRSSQSGDSGDPTRSASSSIPSTPELSRQQSSSSFRSPSSELSQLQGFFAPVQQPIVHNTASHRAHDQPIPEMMSIDFKERTQAVDTWARLPSRPEDNDEANALLKPYIARYLETTDKLLLGERTVLIQTAAVGQKSYGSERRFLVPPPSAFLLGASWWTHLPMQYLPQRPINHGINPALQLLPPSFQVAMSTDHKSSENSVEWLTQSGFPAEEQASAHDYPIAGRVVGKQLHIPADKEDKSDKFEKEKQTAEALISVISPGIGNIQDLTIGTFSSKTIKVISKVTKRVVGSKKSSHNIVHGSTVALFNRLRSQTISTRYLCVSSSGASFPAWDWQAITGRSEKPFEDDQASSFIARTSAWDSFVIYAVDPSKAAFGQNTEDKAAKAPLGFPDPPPHALPVPACGPGLPIYYNQPVLLQCMNTGVVSPIMIIRRVDKGNLALGGGESDPQIVRPAFDLPSAPGEALGDAVSQLHRIALEVVADPEKAYASPVDPEAGFVSGGSYLSCFGEKVGVRKAEGPRTPLQNARKGSTSESSTPESGPAENLFDPSSTLPFPGLTTNRGRSQSLAVDGNKEELLAPTTNDGGKVKKLRRATSSIANPIARPATGGRRRGLSTASSVNEATEELATDGAWSQYAGEPGVWTICSTEIARYTFYIPPILFDGLTPFRCRAIGCPDVFLTPIPATPINHVPVISKITRTAIVAGSAQAKRFGPGSHEHALITLYGDNLGSEWTVWFGDTPSPKRAESACSEVLECLEPVLGVSNKGSPVDILLVRTDGVIVPSRKVWSPSM